MAACRTSDIAAVASALSPAVCGAIYEAICATQSSPDGRAKQIAEWTAQLTAGVDAISAALCAAFAAAVDAAIDPSVITSHEAATGPSDSSPDRQSFVSSL